MTVKITSYDLAVTAPTAVAADNSTTTSTVPAENNTATEPPAEKNEAERGMSRKDFLIDVGILSGISGFLVVGSLGDWGGTYAKGVDLGHSGLCLASELEACNIRLFYGNHRLYDLEGLRIR
ncbi:hypothetical protein N0V88_001571 [Collariella sp. IMI 366227]|nr:hypothetical protein N0V88_001571 [Collariella sp. IMI 366227]